MGAARVAARVAAARAAARAAAARAAELRVAVRAAARVAVVTVVVRVAVVTVAVGMAAVSPAANTSSMVDWYSEAPRQLYWSPTSPQRPSCERRSRDRDSRSNYEWSRARVSYAG